LKKGDLGGFENLQGERICGKRNKSMILSQSGSFACTGVPKRELGNQKQSFGTRNKSFWWQRHLAGAVHRLEACATKV
jgi:hypothetical protein